MRSQIITSIVALAIGVAAGAGLKDYWPAIARGRAAAPDPPVAEPHEAAHEETEHGQDKVTLSDEAMQSCGVKVAAAAGGVLEKTLRVPVEISLNADRLAHIVPRVAGTVREVRKNVGDKVSEGEVLAVLESRELAEAKAADLAAEAKLDVAKATFERHQQLRASNVVSEAQMLETRQQHAAAQIEHRTTEARLHALGLDHDQVTKVSGEKIADFGRFEIKAPFAGTVVEKHIALGEMVGSSDVFLIADLSNVWVEVTIYPRDVARVRVGSTLRLATTGASGEPVSAEAKISYVSPIIRESTRTAHARAVIPNPDGQWRPGTFLTGEIVVDRQNVAVLVPNDAVQTLEAQSVLFVQRSSGVFEKRPVLVGGSSATHCEIRSGLKPAEICVVSGASLLKAELAKGEGEHEH